MFSFEEMKTKQTKEEEEEREKKDRSIEFNFIIWFVFKFLGGKKSQIF